MDRISPRTLRYVVIGLSACAVIGLWTGLSDSLRRNAPDWEGGQSQAPVPVVAGPPDAVAFTPGPGDRPIQKPLAAPAPVEETEPPEAKTETPATGQATAPATQGPAPSRPAAGDPIGDLVQEKTAAPPPPEVPF
jgi:hypothetical protein